MKRYIGLFAFVACVVCLYALLEYTPVDDYVDTVKRSDDELHARVVSLDREGTDGELEALLDTIKAHAEQVREDPINAKVDPVWKAIPGYNGVEVDVEKTLAANKGKKQDDQLTYIMREIEPDIQLEELGAHPIYRGNPKKKMAGFMINVAWGDEHLPGILEILHRENVSATFFFDGTWLSKNIEKAREICDAGHECSNHAYTHPNMSGLSRSRQADEIVKTEKLLRDELGVDNAWFAPPSGDYNQTTVDVAYELGLRTVLWTIDTVDWKKPDPGWIVRRITAHLEPGSLILMHPTSSSSQALPGMIAAIRQAGYAFGTVSEVLSSDRVSDVEAIPDF